MSHSNVRDAIMANKLKDGLQDCIVYLRMLEGAKLPGLYERKRKQLMEQLLDLQGDTRKDQPPKFDDDNESLASTGSPQKKAESGSPQKKAESVDGDSSAEVASENANKGRVTGSVSKFEYKPAPSKFKYRTLEQLKEMKRRRESGLPEEDAPKENESTEPDTSPPSVDTTSHSKQVDVVAEKKTDSISLHEEDEDLYDDTVGIQPIAVQQHQEEQQQEEKHEAEETEVKKARSSSKTGAGLMKRLFKKEKKGHISDSASTENLDDLESDSSSIKIDAPAPEEAAPVEEEESEGFNLSAQLEKVTKGRFGKYHYQTYTVVLKEDQVTLTRPKDKEPTVISLVGAATALRDPYQFELHTEDDKSFTFRTDSEEMTIKWVETLKSAIDACTPVEPIEEEPEEEEDEGVPQITISTDNLDEPSPEKDIKESASDYANYVFGKKKKPEMPDLNTVIIRGFLYRKAKFGWDRVWVCLTEENVLFLAANDTTRKVMSSLQVAEGVKIEPKKGSDKYPHCMLVTGGKFKETLATDIKMEFDTWKLCLEQAAAGGGGIQELLSEDEDGGELYEPLEDTPRPYIPSSPRPSVPPPAVSASPRPSLPQPTTADDDIYEGEDIYEGLDDIDMPPTPQLPSRPAPTAAVKSPSLPPRNEPTPTLPPKNEPYKKDVSGPLPPRPPKSNPLPEPVDDDVYDDVMANGGIMEETYDDIMVNGGTEIEETYDDVETIRPSKAPAAMPAATSTLNRQDSGGELYEDMEHQSYVSLEPADKEPEEYLEVQTSHGEAVNDEFYVEVDQPPPRPPPPSTQTSSPAAIRKPIPPVQPQKAPSSPAKSNSVTRSRPSSAPKGNNPSSKVATLSKMFGQSADDTSSATGGKPNKKGTHSGPLLYKSPGKRAFANEWCVLENSVIIFYSSPSDKLSHYRLNVKDSTLKLGAPNGQGSNFSFYITKLSVSHQFSANTLQEMAEWVGFLTSILTPAPSNEHLYKAKRDCSSNKEGNISFKKNDVLWVLGQESPTLWVGVVGTSPSNFSSVTGRFPSDTVEPLGQEDVYI